MRTLVIGDIHGVSSAFDALLATVKPTTDDLLICLGDYVDRGPDSAGVIERLLWYRTQLRMICLRGNHEAMMCEARAEAAMYKMWLGVGGSETLASYCPPGQPATIDRVPQHHWHFLDHDLYDFYESDTHLFVHANVEANKPMDEQSTATLHWMFCEEPTVHQSGKVMVCGHSTQHTGVPAVWPTTIVLDTGVYTSRGWLTCLDVENSIFYQANAAGQTRSIPYRAAL